MSYRDLDPDAAFAEIQRDPKLRILDVRTDDEYQCHRLPNSVLIPLHELPQRFAELDATGRWLIHCEHGARSLNACEFLQQMGFLDLANLRGGLAHWAGRGLPLER
ncbi:MAG: rhodanese-like domain-containing protein [Planctomycetes bacterium]|nr:rhodanese-like domain-containing protein [Planctomycetota bacterium]